MKHNQPIGIFDSGVGGFTVVKAVQAALGQEDIIYLGDTARVPYGGKDKETIVRYAFDSVEFLVSQGAKAIIMACNTSSALALKEVREAFPLPVFGVVEPGAKEASRLNRGGTVAVLATQATVDSHAYLDGVKSFQSLIQVLEIPCPGWVELVEQDTAHDKEGRALIRETMKPIQDADVDTLILGCTHYPLITDIIEDELKDMNLSLEIVDPAFQTAIIAKKVLTEARMLNDGIDGGHLKLFTTKSQPKFMEIAKKVLGETAEEAILVEVAGAGKERLERQGFGV